MDFSSEVGETCFRSLSLCFGQTEKDLRQGELYFLKDFGSNNYKQIQKKSIGCKNCLIF